MLTSQSKLKGILFDSLKQKFIKKNSWLRKVFYSSLMLSLLLNIGIYQMPLHGNNVPYCIDFVTEISVLLEGYCTGQSYTVGESGGVWVINNAEGDPSNCNPNCTNGTGGANDIEFKIIKFDIFCLTDNVVSNDYNYNIDLEYAIGCHNSGFSSGNDGVSFYYNLDAGGSTLIEGVETCDTDSGTFYSTPLNGNTLHVNVVGGTQAKNEFIEKEKILINGIATPPANDDCGSSEVITGNISGDNSCATIDLNLCSDNDHVVYYSYTTLEENATITITGTSTNGGNVVVDIWTDCVAGTPFDATVGCAQSVTISCVPIGTVLTIPVGSTMGDEGGFDLEIIESEGGAANDSCNDPAPATTAVCVPETFTGDTSGACPETFGTCNQNNDPTIWFEFTTLPDISSVTFSNVTGTFQIFEYACPTVMSVGPCISDVTHVNVNPNTQYLISGSDAAGGSISFDLTLNAAAANDMCGNAEDASNGSVSGSTACATADANFCGASGDHVVYYSYTVVGPGVLTVQIDVTAEDAADIALEAWADCSGTDFDDTQTDCALSITLDFVPAGTILTIPVGSEDGAEGTFDMTITEIAGMVINDDCAGAEMISGDAACEAMSIAGDTSGAYPETFAADCSQDTNPTIWYTFTTLTNTTSIDFTNVNGSFQLMSDCPASMAVSGCIDGDQVVTVTGGTQYWLSATLAGGEGAVSVDIAFLEAPANDICTAAEDASGGTASGTTGCASSDGNFCSASSDHVVYYTYTVAGPGAVTVQIDVAGVDATDIAAEAWTDCGGTDFDATVDCGTSLMLVCVPAGTVLTIPIGSADGGEGTFDLTITETTGSGPANDLCDDATQIDITTPCVPESASGTTVDACPETFAGDCTQMDDATIWFTFTTLDNTTMAEFLAITGEIQVFTDCVGSATSGCITGDMVITVNPTTQYWVSATVNGGEGDVGFDVALLEAPGNDACSTAEDASIGAAAGTTACASNDENFCGVSGDHVVYYTYTVVGPGVVTVQIDATAGDATDIAIEAWTDCSGADFDDTQADCATSLTLPCVLAGTVITIPVGSADGGEGSFDLAISETAGTVPNDDCTGALVVDVPQPCDPVSVSGSTTDACPEAFASNCTQDVDPTVWYTFTTLAGTTSIDFTNVNGSFELIADCPATLSASGCIDSDQGVAADPNTTYWLTATVPGSEGDFSFDIAFLEAPGNDLCNDAFGAGTTTTVGNNGCASADADVCGGTDHVVYYTYTVAGPGSVTLEVTVNEITASGINFIAFDGCGGALMDEECGASGTLSIDCVPEWTEVIIAVGTAENNTGDFDITVGEVPGDSGPANDFCFDAEIIDAAECHDTSVSGSTTDACPEFVSGCSEDMNPAVWYQVNTPAGTTSVDFLNLSSNLNLAIYDACNGKNLGCITGDMNVSGLPSTFWIAAFINGGEGSFNFEINAKALAVNDFCANAIDGGGTETTCCSTGDNVGCSQDLSVWYSYTPSDLDAAVIVSASGGTIGSMAVDVFVGECTALASVPGGECVNGTDLEIAASCIDGATVFVQVSSTSEDVCGTHTVTFTEESGCDQGLSCDTASDQSMTPITNEGEVCVSSCNNYVCDAGCGDNPVWFEVTTDADASILNVQIDGCFAPMVCIYEDVCGGGLVYSGVGDIANVPVLGNLTYYIAVGIASGDACDFNVCVQTFLQLVDCAVSAEIEPTRPEYPDSNPDGPYSPGETVNFCYSVDFNIGPVGDLSGNNCQWIQGIIPVVGCGWDSDLNDIANQPPGGWFWLDEGEVNYNVSNPFLSLSSECCGGLSLEYGDGGLSAGDELPGGFWFTSPGGGANCTNDGTPNTMWGLPGACGSSQSVEFCFDLTVKNVAVPSECDDDCNSDLKIHIFTFADGETGCWSSSVCVGDMPIAFDAFMDCCSLVTTELLSGELEICSGESPMLEVIANDGFSTIVLESDGNPNISGATLSGAFPGGEGSVPDILVNSGSDPETIVYEFFTQSPNPDSECNGPRIFVEVVVYPDIVIEFDEPYDVCFDDQEEIIPTISGGSGVYDIYEWSNGESGASTFAPQIVGDDSGSYQYMLTVSDDFGCTREATVEYIIRPEVIHLLNQTSEFACIDGEDNFEEICAQLSNGGANGPFIYTWTYDSDLIVNEFENCIIIDDENSTPGFYEVTLEIEDIYGCIYNEGPIYFSVENGPDVYHENPFCISKEGGDIEYSFEVCDDNNGSAEWSLFDESCSIQLDGPYSGTCYTFFVTPFAPGDDIPVTYCVQAIDLATGCIAYHEVTIDPPAILNSLDTDNPPLSYTVFPNPTNGQLNISGLSFDKVIIVNMLGTVLKTYHSNEIDITNFPDGVYFLVMYFDGAQVSISKILKN